MKTLLNVGNGALVITEEAGDFTIAVSKAALVGGGSVTGIVSLKGEAKIVVKGKLAFDAGMKLLEAHSPAALVPIEQGAAAVVDGVLSNQ